MRIFAIDCSATAASVAIMDENKLISESFTNTGLTHSQTLMPMVESSLKNADIDLDSIDTFAIAAGPGSFTGVRIGIAAVKGLAFTSDKPCVSVSTLEAMAYNLLGRECIACCVMDARCNQVYNAIFKVSDKVERLTQDNAILIDDLKKILKNYNLPIVFVGDGAEMCYNVLKNNFSDAKVAPVNIIYQRASSVAQCAFEMLKTSEPIGSEQLLPVYLRVPQAERELKKRMNKN